MAALAIALTSGTGQMARATASPAPVNLGAATPFVILTKTGITDVPSSDITGDVGTSPITGAAIGLTCIEVTGTIYSVDAAGPACEVINPSLLTAAVGDMQTAYTDAAGRAGPDFTELYAGNLSGKTLVPGLYKWSTDVLITTDATLAGPADAVWIFQIAGNLTLGSGAKILLSGAPQARNIFWQVGGGVGVVLGTTAHVEGTILAVKAIHLRTGASLNGRALSQTAVTLDQNTLVLPVAITRLFLPLILR